ncbi:hypothetical protein C0993_008995 [Termitomyces sp. T159_Od127]|nr:hypothetical protein C0993_008995 [Termitomyces sp. T159_Od127]
MGFAPFHAHKAHARIRPRAASAGCNTGGFYASPTTGATIDALQPFVLKWDPTCIDSQKVDIYLLAPSYPDDRNGVANWTSVSNADAQKSVTVVPKWSNSTSELQVQLTIVAAGIPSSMAMLPAGPIFTLTSNGTAPASPLTADAGLGSSGTSKSISPGATAAAVLFPLLIVGAAIFAYLRYQRRRASAKSKRFSQALDKRMSTISADWKSISAAGAHAAIRSSIAATRDSAAFSFGHIRPSIDAPAPAATASPQMKQVRTGTGVGLRNPGAAAAIAAERASRVSRVSFADTLGRPSTDSRRPRGAQGRGSAYVPPVPSRRDVVSGAPSVYPDSEIESEAEDPRRAHHAQAQMSPRQTTGPLTLTPEDIHARMHGRLSPAPEKNEEYDEVMPALSMMRLSSNMTDSYLLPQPPPVSLSAYTHQQEGQEMSPDAMLRAYAVRTPPPPSSSASPKVKGRKLSIRASLGLGFAAFGKRERERAQSPMTGEAGMAGVGVRNVVAGGAAGGYQDKGDVYDSAYGGVGRPV